MEHLRETPCSDKDGMVRAGYLRVGEAMISESGLIIVRGSERTFSMFSKPAHGVSIHVVPVTSSWRNTCGYRYYHGIPKCM